MSKVDTILVGAAGEHLVLSRLLARGMLAAQAPRGVRKVDILVNHLDDRPPVLIQVKTTTTGQRSGWTMSSRHEHIRDQDLFYCFVDLKPDNPTVHVIPAAVVADVLTQDHDIWIATPGKHGQPHNPTAIRSLRPGCAGQDPGWMDPFLENWTLGESPT